MRQKPKKEFLEKLAISEEFDITAGDFPGIRSEWFWEKYRLKKIDREKGRTLKQCIQNKERMLKELKDKVGRHHGFLLTVNLQRIVLKVRLFQCMTRFAEPYAP